MVVGYSAQPRDNSKVLKARASDLRIHFKNTREVVKNLQGMKLGKARKYLADVLAHKRCIPYRRYRYAVGRTAQAKEFGCNEGRWPAKPVKAVDSMLRNAESNAVLAHKDWTGKEDLVITHICAKRARLQRRRTYRAHGRVNPYMSTPSHIEVIVTEKTKAVKPPAAKKQ
jgi:large subunit ribosomal protein L17e